MDVFYFFIELGLDLLKEGGRLGYIIMEYWNSRGSGEILRKKIMKDAVIEKVINFDGFTVFPDAPGQHNSIVILKKQTTNKIKDSYPVEVVTVTDEEVEVSQVVKALLDNKFSSKIVKEKKVVKFDKIRGKITFLTKEKESVIAKIEKIGSHRVPSNNISQGIVLPQSKVLETHAEKYPDADFVKGDGIFLLSDDELDSLSLNKSERELMQPFYHASQIEDYYYDEENSEWVIYGEKRYLEYDNRDVNKKVREKGKDKEHIQKNVLREVREKYPVLTRHLDRFQKIITSSLKPYGIHRSRTKDVFINQRKIISVRKTDRPKFAWVPIPYFMDQSVFYIIPPENMEPEYLTAILNSTLMWFWFRYGAQKMHGDQLQLDKEILETVPIFVASKDKQNIIAEQVDNIISLKKEINGIDCEFSHYIDIYPRVDDVTLGKFLEKLNLEVQDKEVLNRANRREGKVTEFEIAEKGAWLEFTVEFEEETKKGKTRKAKFRAFRCKIEDEKIRKFLYHSIKEFITPSNIGKGNLYEGILKIKIPRFYENWEKNIGIIKEIMNKYLPRLDRWQQLHKKIKATDQKIDESVYDLYGLTDEEIKIVEESFE